MAEWIPYKSMWIYDDTPTGDAGLAINNNFTYIADTFNSQSGLLDNGDVNIVGGDIYGCVIEQLGPFISHQSNPQISPTGVETYTCYGSVIKVNDTYHSYYSYATPSRFNVGHATSVDGKIWTKDIENNPVLAPEVGGSTTGVLGYDVPFVWYEDNIYHMLCRVHGNLGSALDATSYATSLNPEGPFLEANGKSPVLQATVGAWDAYGAEAWGTIKIEDTYHTFYEASVGGVSINRAVGRAYSTDLLHWTKDTTNNPIWESGRFCPDVFEYGQYYYAIVPHYPVAGLGDYTEFELYRDDNITFLPTEREYLGVIKEVSYNGWDSVDIDTPFILTDNIYRNSFSASSGELWMYYSGQGGAAWEQGLAISSRLGGGWANNNPTSRGRGLGFFRKLTVDTLILTNSLAIAQGGTGSISASGALVNLGIGNGVTGSFIDNNGYTVTVVSGIITNLGV
jgi:hypothetical protein